MTQNGRWTLLLTLVCGLGSGTRGEPFHDGDRWIAIGDSITHHGSFTRFVELFYLTRYPEISLVVRNGGIDGDTARAAVRRLEWDVEPEHPTVATIMLGMNDVDRDLYLSGRSGPEVEAQRRDRIDEYGEGVRTLIDRLRAHRTRVILMSPSPFDNSVVSERVDRPGTNAALAECALRARWLASEAVCPFVEIHGPMTDLNLARQRLNPRFTVVSPDRVHPRPMGELVMTYFFLKAQGVMPCVARLAIDAPTARITAAENCRAGPVLVADGRISFSYRARALPFPVEDDAIGALDLVPFAKDLNEELLQVAGLAKGDYELRVDGQKVGVIGHAQLAKGVNLAALPTPQLRQAEAVAARLKEKSRLEVRLRTMAWVVHDALDDIPLPPDASAVAPKLAAQMARYKPMGAKVEEEVRVAQQQYREEAPIQAASQGAIDEVWQAARAEAQPREHHITLQPVEAR